MGRSWYLKRFDVRGYFSPWEVGANSLTVNGIAKKAEIRCLEIYANVSERNKYMGYVWINLNYFAEKIRHPLKIKW